MDCRNVPMNIDWNLVRLRNNSENVIYINPWNFLPMTYFWFSTAVGAFHSASNAIRARAGMDRAPVRRMMAAR